MKRAPGMETVLFSIILLVVMSVVGALHFMYVSNRFPPDASSFRSCSYLFGRSIAPNFPHVVLFPFGTWTRQM